MRDDPLAEVARTATARVGEPDEPRLPREAIAAHERTSGLYLIRCGSSASAPRVSVTQSTYSPQPPSNHVTCESPSKARMWVAIRSRNQRSWVMTTAQPAKSSSASSSARSVSTSRSLVGSSSSSRLPPLLSSLARWTRLRSPPESWPTFFCWSPPLKLNQLDVLARVDLALAELDQVVAAADLLEDRVLRVEAVARLVDVGELDRVAERGACPRRASPRRRSCGRASSCRRRWAR